MAVTLKGYTANYLGLSTDAKPTEADDNAIFRELDTGKRYYFTGAAWAEIPSSGGGGGGDVTSVNGKTGAVTLTATDVGAYTTAEADTLLGGKADKVSGASAGDLAGLDANGDLTDSGINAAVIPSTASTSNKLSTAADTAGEDITATANSEDIALTDSADARVHDLKIYGKTVDGHSVGENGLTVTACGKNLFNINGKVNAGHHWNQTPKWWEDFDGADKSTVENGVLTANAKYSSVNPWGQIINIKRDEWYTVSFKCLSFGTGTGVVLIVYGYTPDQSNVITISSNIYTSGVGNVLTAYVKSTEYEGPAVFGFGSRDASGAQFSEIMIQKGQGSATYEEYKGEHNLNVATGIPLRGIYKTLDLGDLNWTYQTTAQPGDPCSLPRFGTNLGVVPDAYIPSVEFGVAMSSCSSRYTPAVDPVLGGNTDKTICFGKGKGVYVVDHDYTDAAAFKAAVTGITLTYPSYCDEIDLADGVAITRLDSNGDVLATPVTTPLSDAEKAAFAEFRTFDGNTNVTATDDPFMTLNYVKNTDNGKALANVDDRVDNKVDKNGTDRLMTAAEGTKLAGIETGATKNTVIDTTCTLTVAGWTGAAAPYTQTVNVTNVLSTDKAWCDLSVSSTVATGLDEIDDWSLISKIESGAGTLTFSCYEEKPTTELNVNVKVVR